MLGILMSSVISHNIPQYPTMAVPGGWTPQVLWFHMTCRVGQVLYHCGHFPWPGPTCQIVIIFDKLRMIEAKTNKKHES